MFSNLFRKLAFLKQLAKEKSLLSVSHFDSLTALRPLARSRLRAPSANPKRETCKVNGSPPYRNFHKTTLTPTFKKPLKPRLLLFDLIVQTEPARCLWVLAPHT